MKETQLKNGGVLVQDGLVILLADDENAGAVVLTPKEAREIAAYLQEAADIEEGY